MIIKTDRLHVRFRGWMIEIYLKGKSEASQNTGERRRSFGGGGDVRRHPGRDSGWSIAPGLPYSLKKLLPLSYIAAQRT